MQPPIENQPRERRESGHRPKKDKKSEHSTKDANRHKGRRSRQASQSEKHGDASAPDHGVEAAKPAGKHLAKPHVAAARKETSTSSVSTAKTEVTDVKVAAVHSKENNTKAAQPASG